MSIQKQAFIQGYMHKEADYRDYSKRVNARMREVMSNPETAQKYKEYLKSPKHTKAQNNLGYNRHASFLKSIGEDVPWQVPKKSEKLDYDPKDLKVVKFKHPLKINFRSAEQKQKFMDRLHAVKT